MGDVRAALANLRRAAESGVLAALCRSHDVRLLVVFGSAVRDGAAAPRDLDVAVSFRQGSAREVLTFAHGVSGLARSDALDLMDLDRAGPVARERALVATLPLFEAAPGVFANAQMAAVTERMDTDWLRQLDLELMAE